MKPHAFIGAGGARVQARLYSAGAAVTTTSCATVATSWPTSTGLLMCR